MAKKDHILVVVDPTADTQPAVRRGMHLAKHCGWQVELFICGYSPQLVGAQLLNADKLERAKQGYLAGQKKLLEAIAEPYVADGIDVTLSTSWDHPLYEGIIRQTLHSDPRLVVKDTHYHSKLSRTLFTHTDWHLIRSCAAPVWLVRNDRSFDAPVVLAAVDPLHDHDKPATHSMRGLVSEAFGIADQLNGVVHLLHAYNPFIEPDDPKIRRRGARGSAAETGGRAAVAEWTACMPGQATRSICCHKLPGTLTPRSWSWARYRARDSNTRSSASTAENVLDLLPCDVLVVKPKGFVSPVTFKSAPKDVIYAEDA